jgi:hypothetical protein
VRAPLVLSIVATVAAAASAAAPATIVPGRGIAGIALWMTEAQAQAAIGAPVRVTRSRGALGLVVTRLHYRGLDVDLQRLRGRSVVVRVFTTRVGERMSAGVGVGSPLAALRGVAGIRCWSEGAGTYCGSGNRDTPLARFTLFWIGPHERASRVVVGLVVNS